MRSVNPPDFLPKKGSQKSLKSGDGNDMNVHENNNIRNYSNPQDDPATYYYHNNNHDGVGFSDKDMSGKIPGICRLEAGQTINMCQEQYRMGYDQNLAMFQQQMYNQRFANVPRVPHFVDYPKNVMSR